ncbi:MAG TPA: hypothetical protein VKV16_10130 [Solirubrobacteraceae bacterium]|nr:hypothetical protein [Solirubrobacteraceae bacterium]
MRPLLTWPCLALSALALSACGATSTTSTSGFSGVKEEVARRIADFQSDANGAEQKKVCGDDLSARLVARLGGRGRCEAAIKKQLQQIDNPELTIESVRIGAGERTATASVKSIHEGKSRASSLSLVKEGGGWRIAGS